MTNTKRKKTVKELARKYAKSKDPKDNFYSGLAIGKVWAAERLEITFGRIKRFKEWILKKIKG